MDDIADVGNADDERELADDLRTVDRDNVGHQAEHADRGEADDHHHDLHDNFQTAVDELTDLLTLFAGGEHARAEENGDHDDRQHIRLDHRLKEVAREDGDDRLHDGRSFLCLIRQLAQLRRGEGSEAALEDVDQHQTDDDRQSGGEHIVDERLDADRADTLEVIQGDNAVSNGEQHHGNDQEFQQVHIDRADGLDPFGGKSALLEIRENQTGDDTERHTDEYFDRQTELLLLFHLGTPFTSCKIAEGLSHFPYSDQYNRRGKKCKGISCIECTLYTVLQNFFSKNCASIRKFTHIRSRRSGSRRARALLWGR